MNKKKQWTVAGYYLDGKQAWTILENKRGKTKMVKGIQS